MPPEDDPITLGASTTPPMTDTPPPASNEAEAPPTPASQDEPIPATDPLKDDPPKKEDPPKPTAREKLIAKLTGEEDELPPEKTDPEPPAPQDKGTTTPSDDKTKSEKPADPPKPDDLTELTNDTAKAMKPGEVRRKINRLIERVKESEPLADLGKEIIETCKANGLSPDDYRAWVNIGIGLQKNDASALEAFASIAKKAGVIPEAAPSGPDPEIAAWIEGQEKALEMSAETAAELRKRLGIDKTPPAAQPTPKPAAKPAAAPQPQTRQPDAYVQAKARASAQIERAAETFEKQIGEARFKELEPRIMAKLAERKGAHPDAWPDIFRSIVEAEIARAPKPAQIPSTIRPGGGNPPEEKPAFKSERERVIHTYTG